MTSAKARWQRALGVIGLFTLAFIVPPPLPPSFRVIAFAAVVLVIMLAALGALPRLRVMCQRWLAALGIT